MNRYVTPAGRAVVLACAAVLSFSALFDLAVLCGFRPWQAALFPIMVDAGAAIAFASWKTSPRARRMAITLMATTVIGNAVAHILIAYQLQPNWSVVVLVAGLAPAVLVAAWHLDTVPPAAGGDLDLQVDGDLDPVMDIQEPGLEKVDIQDLERGLEPDLDTPVEPGLVPRLEVVEPQLDEPASPALEPQLEKARELVRSEGAGRPRLKKELGLSEGQAKQVIRDVKGATNGKVVA